jgi:hypothetical protein
MAGNIRSNLPQLRVAAAFLAAATALPAANARAAVAATILPDGTYAYAIADDEGAASTSTIVVTRAGNVVAVAEHASPMEPTEVTRRTLDAATFATQGFTRTIGGRRISTLTIHNGKAALAENGRTVTIASSSATAPLAVCDFFPATFFPLPAILHFSASGNLTLANLFLKYSALPLTTSAAAARRPPSVPAEDAAIAITIDGETGTMWYDPKTYVLDRFELPSQRLVISLQSRTAAIDPLP